MSQHQQQQDDEPGQQQYELQNQNQNQNQKQSEQEPLNIPITEASSSSSEIQNQNQIQIQNISQQQQQQQQQTPSQLQSSDSQQSDASSSLLLSPPSSTVEDPLNINNNNLNININNFPQQVQIDDDLFFRDIQSRLDDLNQFSLISRSLHAGQGQPSSSSSSSSSRLKDLFGQIEKDFQLVWDENLKLREIIDDLLSNYLTSSSSSSHPSSSSHIRMRRSLSFTPQIKQQIPLPQQHQHSLLMQQIGKQGQAHVQTQSHTQTQTQTQTQHQQQEGVVVKEKTKGRGKKKKKLEWTILSRLSPPHRDGIWEVTSMIPCNGLSSSSTSLPLTASPSAEMVLGSLGIHEWDRSVIATASADRTARIWNTELGIPIATYVAHKGSVNSIRFHPFQRYLVCTSSGDGTVHIWKVPKVEEFFQEQHEGEQREEQDDDPNIHHRDEQLERDQDEDLQLEDDFGEEDLQLSPKKESRRSHNFPQLSTAPSSVTLTRPLTEIHINAPVSAADWVGNDKLATGSWDGRVSLWNESGRQIWSWDALSSSPLSPQPGCPPGTPSLSLTERINNISGSAGEGNPFLSAHSDGSFGLWDPVRSPNKPVSFVQHAHTGHGGVSSAIFASPFLEPHIICSGGAEDKTLKIWDRRNGFKAPLSKVSCSAGINRFSSTHLHSPSPALSAQTESSNIGSGGVTMVGIPCDNRRVNICDLKGNCSLGRVRSEGFHVASVTSTAWSPDASVLFTAGFDRVVNAWAEPFLTP